jgi:hypothetical protein
MGLAHRLIDPRKWSREANTVACAVGMCMNSILIITRAAITHANAARHSQRQPELELMLPLPLVEGAFQSWSQPTQL